MIRFLFGLAIGGGIALWATYPSKPAVTPADIISQIYSERSFRSDGELVPETKCWFYSLPRPPAQRL